MLPTTHMLIPRTLALMAACALLAFALAACGDDGGDGDDAAQDDDATEIADAPVLTIINETDCNVQIRFDNELPVTAVVARMTVEYSDERLDEYRFMQVESTRALWRNIDLAPVRDAGWTVTISDAVEDHACFDTPGAGVGATTTP